MTISQSDIVAKKVQEDIIDASFAAHVGHVGSCLSIVHILCALYTQVLSNKKLTDPLRDRVILSKGHAALALYAVLFEQGMITKKHFNSFHTDSTDLGVHPEFGVTGVEVATGSLGQGICFASGIALAQKLKATKSRTYVVLSDAELNEGSTWEAAIFCAHHRLPISVIIDANGQQGFGYTKDVADMGSIGNRWKAFGWQVHDVDGHNMLELTTALRDQTSLPTVVIARTTLGKGVSFMEGKIDWHYLPLTQEQYLQAKTELQQRKKS